MKLSHALLLTSGAVSPDTGSCGGTGWLSMICETNANFINVGRRSFRRALYGEDSWIYTVMGTEKSKIAAKKNYRQIVTLDEKTCSKDVLDALYTGELSFELFDKSPEVMQTEAMYTSFDNQCWPAKRGIYLQFKRTALDSKKDWVNRAKNRDMYYFQLKGIKRLSELGISDASLNKCIISSRVQRVDDNNDASDYTRLAHYIHCGKKVDWDATTSTTTSPTTGTTTSTTTRTTTSTTNSTTKLTTISTPKTSTTIRTTRETTKPDKIPDHTVFCNGDTCDIILKNGVRFIGKEKDGVVYFRSIPYAEAPVKELRWKYPVIKYEYEGVVDATNTGAKCMTTKLDDTEESGFSEDCLFLNIQVSREVLENGTKKSILYYIHGGGFNGGSGQGDFSKTVKNQDLVVVGVNYRLGPFGFLYLNSAEEDQDFRGNWGLLDQQAGMKWINHFGSLFGGDTNSVTITGGSAGSESCWRHLTIPSSWPYFTRAAPIGIGLLAGSKSAGIKTETLTSAVYEFAKCPMNDIECLREVDLVNLKEAAIEGEKAVKYVAVSMVLKSGFAPVHTSDLFNSTLYNDIANGNFKPNTDILWTYSEWEAFGMTAVFFGQQSQLGGLLGKYKKEIHDEKEKTGFKVPYPYPHYLYTKLFGEFYAEKLIQVFGCTEGEDCEEQLTRFVVATQWVCSTKNALDNRFNVDQSDTGNLYPVQYEEPTCDKDDNGVPTKACHGAEGATVRGGMYDRTDFGKRVSDAYGAFYRTGDIPDEFNLPSYRDMDYLRFNAISSKRWVNDELRQGWLECEILDELHTEFNWYNWGIDTLNGNSMLEN